MLNSAVAVAIYIPFADFPSAFPLLHSLRATDVYAWTLFFTWFTDSFEFLFKRKNILTASLIYEPQKKLQEIAKLPRA